MQTLAQSPFLKALGWTLINSLWQFGVLWLLFTLFLHTKKKCSPAIKHGLALVLMSVGFLLFTAGLSLQYFTYADSSRFASPLYNSSGFTFYTAVYMFIKTFLEGTLSYFSIFYLIILVGFFCRFFRFFFYAHSVQTMGLTKMKPELRLYVQTLVQQLNIIRPIQIWISSHVDTPMVIGFIKPIILVPVACINQLSTRQLEAILLHELAHIKRNDYLVNLYIAIIEILFFFNPFAALLIRCIKQEREKSCDDWVLQFRFDAYQYASALLSLEKSRSGSYSLAIAAAGENKNLLLQRVQRIMGVKKAKKESGFRLLAYFFTVGLLGFIALTDPGNLVMQRVEALYTDTKNASPLFTNALARTAEGGPVVSIRHKTEKIRYRSPKTETQVADTSFQQNTDEQDMLALPASITITGEYEQPRISLLQSTNTDNIDFSIKEKDAELPETVTEAQFPFVPNSSYSYYDTEDSTIIKLKVENLKNKTGQTISGSLAQAQKAVEKLDWNKIAKRQNLSPSAIVKLQADLKQSFHNLNWSQIYKETADSINKLSTDKMRSSLKQEYEKLNSLRSLQQEYETIKTELQQQQEKYKHSLEIEIQQINDQIRKKKVIVYI